ncbi:DciA family protein [Marinobacter lutaoensis]|jgi:hypothetical protein|uniref:RNA-binding protein n=1 Tax=Marinobacter lutaoensis TaxID=135739 RepID=A0A1V2DPT5_9GAMM|nr:DciA family protein [Marinobacter lutaoensis]MBE02048.1 DUF721 domain-containing protein [Marinobacter sp.]MBI43568.1 DUF721 domain-containing protein [Oceanospirillales bacterium]NVD35298.1 DUF721 domain-containing protein [Marinobacter lutaoensis]ONF42673.1 hypothetical protein BTO32_13345 [Marinobacter lutaoensis]|tara:strand:- start:4425 stop:4871 length:447 start_codon:yes stop_codon:yes gene_type:complete
MASKNDQKLSFDKFRGPPTLRQLIAKAEQHREAEQTVLRALPRDLAQGVRFLACQDGELTLSAENATQASQIRFRQHEIMASVRQDEAFQYVWKLKVKVVPPKAREKRRRIKPRLSKENARLLAEEAGHTKDKALREVLEKLASHVRD